jgi:hypothetical protein
VRARLQAGFQAYRVFTSEGIKELLPDIRQHVPG